MKRTLCTTILMLCLTVISAQKHTLNNGIVQAKTKVLALVRPNDTTLRSDDPMVKIRQQPTVKANAVGEIYFFEGLGTAVLLEEKTQKWVCVGHNKTYGYSNSNFLDTQDWYTGKGEYRLIADGLTPIYVESMADGDDDYRYDKALCYAQSGMILADKFSENEQYYILETAHTGLFIPKTRVRKEKRR